jgi:hypothetical protein
MKDMKKSKVEIYAGIFLVFFLILFSSVFVSAYPISDYTGTGYGSPNYPSVKFNLTSDNFTLTPSNQNVTLHLEVKDTYVFKRGYVWNFRLSSWIPFDFPETPVAGSYWIASNASKDLVMNAANNLDNGVNYVITYSCTKVGSSWKCGCENGNDTSCGKWMLQIFEVSNATWTQNITDDVCATDFDCNRSMDQRCVNNQCAIPLCTEDINCSAGFFCVNSTCSYRGFGTLANPFLIYNWADLYKIRFNSLAYYTLMVDLSSSDSDYIGIGDNWQPIQFSGTFDGNKHTISNLKINMGSNVNMVGLFSTCKGMITRLGVTNANVVGGYRVGILCGWLHHGGKISQVYTTGNATAINIIAGGLVGASEYDSASISDSYSLADTFSGQSLSGYRVSGGLVGNIFQSIVNNSYSIGKASTGGLIGSYKNSGGQSINSYYDASTSGMSDNEQGIPKTTAEMKKQLTFVGWDFTNTWAIDPAKNNGYPYLRWQNL